MNTRDHTKKAKGISVTLRSPSRVVLIGLNLVVYYFLYRWLTANIDPDRLAGYLKQIPDWAILGSLSINIAALSLYGVRMSLLLGRGFQDSFSIINIGYALNTVMPLRLGEPLKLYLGHWLYSIPMAGLLAASVMEKLVDLGKLLLLGGIVLAFAAGKIIQINVLLPITVFGVAAIFAFILFRIYIVRIVRMLPKGSRLRRLSIEVHKHAGDYSFGRILFVTTGIWILNIALVYFTFNSYLPGVRIDLLDAVALLLILALAVAVPGAPGGLGFFEAGIVAYLTQKFHIDNEESLAAAVVFHFVITVPQVILTGWLIAKCNKVRRVRNSNLHG